MTFGRRNDLISKLPLKSVAWWKVVLETGAKVMIAAIIASVVVIGLAWDKEQALAEIVRAMAAHYIGR